jgi:chromosome segregation ATPase
MGVIVAKLGGIVGNRRINGRGERDPRDASIRSLEAELRIARSDLEKAQTMLEDRSGEIEDARQQNSHAESQLKKQEETILTLRKDLKDSVRKTHELRSELSNRATENLRSEAKLRQTQTELSVAQASNDLIATGVLDYSVAPDAEEDECATVRSVHQ